ncbi:hypothetical protein [Sphingobium sp. SCG-1]|uniref:hypothetical protein n=1 Tax=Sphingobium sp. SCG-1 TaxID=2072936 RepID=UPI0011AB49D3|nr:hypothetical protein [Sphingobium sp. SCG-1]
MRQKTHRCRPPHTAARDAGLHSGKSLPPTGKKLPLLPPSPAKPAELLDFASTDGTGQQIGTAFADMGRTIRLHGPQEQERQAEHEL